jgi:hypothetical protein
MVPLSVELRSRSLGRTGLRVRLARKLNEPSLLRPTQDSVSFALAMPRLAMGEVERETGGLIVYAPGSLRVTPADVSGLRPVAVDAALNGVPSVQPQGVEVVLSYLYAEKGGKISFEARRRPPYVTVRQALRARFESASVRFDLTLFPEVRYSGIERLRLDLPADLPQVRSLTADVRLVPYRGDAPEDLAEGYTAWLLEPQTEFIGARTVQLTWESPMEALDVGKSVSMALPRPIVQGVDRTFGQILLDKAQGIDVQPEQSEGVRFIDPRHDLMAGLQAGGASVAFEFHGDWQLQARASRYEPQDVKVTSIERGLVRMVLTRGGVTSVQAVYKLSTMRQRLVLDLPEGASFDTQHLWLNGRSASLERGQGGTRLVPLQGLPQGKPFLLELRYTVPGGQVLMPPSFPEEPAVQKIYLSVHAPSEMAYLGHRGEWHPEFSWTFGDGGGLCPRGSRTDSNCMSWVCEGLSVDQQQLMNFATDGFHLLYSTLRPEPGDAGALRIVLMRTWQVRAILVLVILIVGALLIRASLAAKVAGAVGVFVAWVLVMMVLPSFGKSLLGNMALGATLVVGAVWFLWYVVALKPTLRLAQMARRPPPPPIPPAKADAEATDEPADQEGGTDHE